MLSFLWNLFLLTLTVGKGALSALVVIYPSYKTYKALESRDLKLTQSMLVYWTVTAFVNSGKEFADSILGSFANFFVWQFIVLVLRVAPLILGPERMYNTIIAPFYAQNEEKVDAVVDEMKKVKSIAVDAVPAVKSGDASAVQAKASEIVDVVAADSSALVNTIKEQAVVLAETLEKKSEELGYAWDKKGLVGLTAKITESFDILREQGAELMGSQWQQHGPLVMKQTETVRAKAGEYAPLMKEKALGLYNDQIIPRVQPVFTGASNKFNDTVKPFVASKTALINSKWEQYGGPVRSVYASKVQPFLRNTAQPMLTEKVIPFVVDTLLPEIYETILALKNYVMDLTSGSPSDAVKADRVHHKRRRADARKERKASKLNADAPVFHSELAPSTPVDVEQSPKKKQKPSPATPAAPLDSIEEVIKPTAELSNRKTGISTDASLEKVQSDSFDVKSKTSPSAEKEGMEFDSQFGSEKNTQISAQ